MARTTPFRYEEKDINYASDEEDLQYRGTSSEKGSSSSDTGSPRYERRESSSRESHGYRPYVPVSSTGCLLFAIVVIALLVLVALVFVGILSFLAPVLFPVLSIAVILWLLSGIFNR